MALAKDDTLEIHGKEKFYLMTILIFLEVINK